MKEKHAACILKVREDYIEIELYLTADQSKTSTFTIDPDLVPEELRDYGHAVWLVIETGPKYSFEHRIFCISDKMQKQNDEMKEFIKTFH